MYTPFVHVLALISPSQHKPSSRPKVSSIRNHCGAAPATPIGVRYAAIARCQETIAAPPRKLLLCRTNSYPTVQQAVSLAVLVRGAGPVAQDTVARELMVHFPYPGRARESRSVRLVHHRDDSTSTTNPLVSGDLLHFLPFKRSRTSYWVTWYEGAFPEKLLSIILR